MHPFLQGILAGYGIAIPVGAIAVLIIETGLRRGFPRAAAAGSGAATADLLYATLAAIAGQGLSALLAPYAEWLRWLSAAVLVGIGLIGLLNSLKPKPTPQPTTSPLHPSGDRGVWQTYLKFTALTVLNPMTIAYFGAIILGGPGEFNSWQARAVFVAGAALSSLSWQLFLAGVGSLAHRRLSPGLQKSVSIAGNLIVILLGARMLFP
jgi:arginine exporter protein ArgO